MSDDNWFWQVSKMTYFKRLDRLMVGKSKLDLCQDYVGSCICKDQHGSARKIKRTDSIFKMHIKSNRFSLSSTLPILKVNKCEIYSNLYNFLP